MKPIITAEINNEEWRTIANIISVAIPNALVSRLGSNFAAKFYSKIAQQPYSCGYVAKEKESNKILGVIIGSIDYPKAYSIAFKGQLLKLIILANIRLFSWSVIRWCLKGVAKKIKGQNTEHNGTPKAELVAIAVTPEMRGTGLAQKLLEKMEEFMFSKYLNGPYKILTEKENERANKFYRKNKATFIRTNLHHGKQINEWHKNLPC